jgi:hypothetical protein
VHGIGEFAGERGLKGDNPIAVKAAHDPRRIMLLVLHLIHRWPLDSTPPTYH